jgi:hypothetical protein
LAHDGRGAPYYEGYYGGDATTTWAPIMGLG